MKILSAILLAFLFTSGPAHALVWTGFTIDYNEQWLREDQYNRVMEQAKQAMKPSEPSSKKSSEPNFKTDPLMTGAVRVIDGRLFLNRDRMLDDLVNRFPPEQRKEARDVLTQTIGAFNDNVEKLYGVPQENVATGVVALLAGGYAAYYNKPFPEKYIKPTYEQVGAYLRSNPALFEGKTDEKLRSYLRSVGLGMLLQMLQQQVQKSGKPGAVAELKKAGAKVYRAVLNTEPDRVEFTTSGIKFR